MFLWSCLGSPSTWLRLGKDMVWLYREELSTQTTCLFTFKQNHKLSLPLTKVLLLPKPNHAHRTLEMNWCLWCDSCVLCISAVYSHHLLLNHYPFINLALCTLKRKKKKRLHWNIIHPVVMCPAKMSSPMELHRNVL